MPFRASAAHCHGSKFPAVVVQWLFGGSCASRKERLVAFPSSLAGTAGGPHFQSESEQRPHLLCNALTLPSFSCEELVGVRMGGAKGRLRARDSEQGFSRRKLPFVVALHLLSFSYAVPRCACAIGHVNTSQVLLCRMTSFLTFGLVVLVEVVSSGLRRFVQSQVRRPR